MVTRANHPWRRFFVGRSECSGVQPADPVNGRRRLEGKGIAIEAGLQYYLRCINEAPLLTARTERALGSRVRAAADAYERWQQGEVDLATFETIQAAAQEARHQMIRSNLRLVVNIAKQFANRGLPLSDLIEEGNLGLLRAVEGYDPSHETRFSTYASWWIKQAIKRALINSVQAIHIPAYMVEEISKWKQATTQLEDRLGRPPTTEEVAQHLKIKPRKARIIRKAIRAVSNPTRAADPEDGLSLSEMIADERTPRPDELLFSQVDAEMVRRMLARLSAREATILRLRFGFDSAAPVSLGDVAGESGTKIEALCEQVHEAVQDCGDELLLRATEMAFDPACPDAMELAHLAKCLGHGVNYLRLRLLSLYDSLEGQQRIWVGRRFGLTLRGTMTLKEIGKKVGLTRERVRQIEHEALDKMNHLLNGETQEEPAR